MWTIRWLCSYLEGRQSRLIFDGQTSEPFDLVTGVPQGSPLSPILFLLYMTPLYEALEKHGNITVIGFSDDTNLLVAGRDIAANCRYLESAFRVYEDWARTRGLKFAPHKSELMYFTRKHTNITQGVCLSGQTIAPVESVQFLGVWLNRKLQ